MSSWNSDRLDLDQLRRQAKELRNAARVGESASLERIARQAGATEPNAVTLAAAQLVIARELGFASWPSLKAAVESRAGIAQRVGAFLTASVDGRTQNARRLLQDDPLLGTVDLRAAAALGEVHAVDQLIAADPSAVHTVDRERGWPPLLYTCYSLWHEIEPSRAAGMAGVARLLLDAGADPDTNNGARPHRGYRSALHGSVTANNPEIAGLLLERGADPNDGESLYQAAGHRDHQCLRLLLAHGATVAGTWALDVAVGTDSEATRLVLRSLVQQSPDQVSELASGLLTRAAASGSTSVVEQLLAAGADPEEVDREGLSPLRHAVRAGEPKTAATLLSHGAIDNVTDVDRFLGACAHGDRSEAKLLLTEQPDLCDRLLGHDRAAIVEIAGSGAAAEAVRLMLELGFPTNARNTFGETPLHAAASAGDVETVRLLLEHGAELDARDANYNGTPLGYATVSSGERRDTNGEWAAAVRVLLEAGADRTGVWVPGMPPSEEVADVLHSYGITGPQAEGRPA
jgi:ankyrin repeat protein